MKRKVTGCVMLRGHVVEYVVLVMLGRVYKYSFEWLRQYGKGKHAKTVIDDRLLKVPSQEFKFFSEKQREVLENAALLAVKKAIGKMPLELPKEETPQSIPYGILSSAIAYGQMYPYARAEKKNQFMRKLAVESKFEIV